VTFFGVATARCWVFKRLLAALVLSLRSLRHGGGITLILSSRLCPLGRGFLVGCPRRLCLSIMSFLELFLVGFILFRGLARPGSSETPRTPELSDAWIPRNMQSVIYR
jgi:hypothetical protein